LVLKVIHVGTHLVHVIINDGLTIVSRIRSPGVVSTTSQVVEVIYGIAQGPGDVITTGLFIVYLLTGCSRVIGEGIVGHTISCLPSVYCVLEFSIVGFINRVASIYWVICPCLLCHYFTLTQ
jgi:hypothetical protein